MSTSTSGTVKSAERALAIVDALTEQERPLSFGQLVRVLGYPRSSLHQLLRTLIDRRWVEVDATGQYSLGVQSWRAGNAYLRAVDLAERARRYMEAVRDASDETVQLAVLDGRYNVYIAKVDGQQNLVMASAVGRRIEAHATGLGKVLLAGLGEAEFDALFAGVELERFTPTTITGVDELRSAVVRAREDGWGADLEEHTIGVRCVAAPVRDNTGAVAAAMSVSVPTARSSIEREAQIRDVLLESTRGLSQALGWSPDARGRTVSA
ncbi:IclR family transcriptional regulator [Pseudolysinimonas sp.]